MDWPGTTGAVLGTLANGAAVGTILASVGVLGQSEAGPFIGAIGGGLIGLLILIGDIWAIINILQSNAGMGAKLLWILLVVLLPVVALPVVALPLEALPVVALPLDSLQIILHSLPPLVCPKNLIHN